MPRSNLVLEDGECSSPESVDNDDSPDIIEVEHESSFVVDRGNDAGDVEFVLNVNAGIPRSTSCVSSAQLGKSWLDIVTASILTEKEEDVDVPIAKADNRRFKMSCFNCNGEHNMSQCPDPKNMRRIRENQQAFRDKTQNRADGRYHLPSEVSAFKAGRLSDSLQGALGVGPNDIPEYIYRMRKMGLIKGYPPAYLKKAIVHESTGDVLTFHTGDVRADECGSEQQLCSRSLDPNNIIYYFGFNKTYRNLRDREGNFRVPPFEEFVKLHEENLKASWREEEKEKKKWKKRKAKSPPHAILKKAKKTYDVDEKMEAPPSPPLPLHSAPSTVASPTPSSQSPGTPVLSRRSGGAIPKPELHAFSKGIVPFQVDEPTKTTGFLKQMMKKIRKALS